MAKITIKKSEQREIQKFFSRLKEFRKDAVVNARLGNLYTGELKIGTRFYATIIGTGQVVKVVNNVAPSKFRWPVKIGYTPDSRLLQVLETWNIYEEMTAPNLPAHSSSQQWPESDTLFVRGEQFLPGLFVPSTGLVLAAYAFVYYLDDAYHLLPNQDIDLSSEVPVSGANYVLLEVDADRNLQFTAGATVDTRKLLRAEDIPSPSTGFFPLVAIKMYEGQTSFIQSVDDTDITDLRWAGFGGGSLPTLDAGRVVVTDASGNIVTVGGLRYDPTYNCFIVGDHARRFGGTGDIEQFAPDGENPTHIINTWGGVPARILWVAGGTEASPTAVVSGQVLDQPSIPYTWNGADLAPAGRIRVVATEDHATGARGIKWELWACPIGSTTEALVATFDENGIDLLVGTTYNINGSPHTHDASEIVSGTLDDAILPVPTETTLGGVQRNTGSAGQYVTGIDAAGALEYDTPAGGGGREVLTANRSYYVGFNVGTITMTIASPCVVTKVAHGLENNDPIVFRTTGALPTGITQGTAYFVKNKTADTFEISATAGGASINTSGSQSGTHSAHTGNDSNAGLSTGRAGAFLTIQKAIDVTAALDISIYDVTLSVSAGYYSNDINLKSFVGAGKVYITGDTTTPANVIIKVSWNIKAVNVVGIYQIKGFRLIGGTYGIYAEGGMCFVEFGNIEFGAMAVGLDAELGATIKCVANYSVTGGGAIHCLGSRQGTIQVQSRTVTVSGTPAFSSGFAYADLLGMVDFYASTVTGAATGKRYYANVNAVIYTNGGGANYFPGNVAGSVASGGQYV